MKKENEESLEQKALEGYVCNIHMNRMVTCLLIVIFLSAIFGAFYNHRDIVFVIGGCVAGAMGGFLLGLIIVNLYPYRRERMIAKLSDKQKKDIVETYVKQQIKSKEASVDTCKQEMLSFQKSLDDWQQEIEELKQKLEALKTKD